MVPGNVDQKASVTTGATVRKKKSMRIRALSAKQRRDDSIRALQKEHLGEIQALLQLDKPGPVEVSECVFFFMNSQPYSIARKLWCVCRYFLSIACTNVDTLFTWHYFGGRIAMTSQSNTTKLSAVSFYNVLYISSACNSIFLRRFSCVTIILTRTSLCTSSAILNYGVPRILPARKHGWSGVWTGPSCI